MDYPEIEVEKIKGVVGSNILFEWQEANPDLLGGRLVRPETERAKHYCGVVIKKGPDVESEDIQVGSRVLWEQFSNFDKFQSPDGQKRYAIVREDACICVIPHRTSIKCDDWAIYGEGNG